MTRVNIGRVESQLLRLLKEYLALFENLGNNEPNQGALLDLGKKIYRVLVGAADIEFPLELLFDKNQHLSVEIFCLPFELIATEAGEQICYEKSLVRVLVEQANQRMHTLPIHVLIVIAQPSGTGELHARLEIEQIRTALGANYDRLIIFDIIDGQNTQENIRKKVQEKPFQIIELIIHGTDDSDGIGGAVIFEDPAGRPEPIPGAFLAPVLSQGRSRPSLVFLNGCLTGGGQPPRPDRFSNVAWLLLAGGIPAVIAMQTRVPSDSAAGAGATFYSSLISPQSLDECVRKMRFDLGPERFYAPILATHQGFDRQFFTNETVQLLRKLPGINREINRRLDQVRRVPSDENMAHLVDYIGDLDSTERRWIHKREEIAEVILRYVADKLGIHL